jgi:hypothetical protein
LASYRIEIGDLVNRGLGVQDGTKCCRRSHSLLFGQFVHGTLGHLF